jgi:hypothetical protein
MAAAVEVLIQAEDVLAEGASPRPGYAFLDPRDEVANWASICCSPTPGFPNAPGRFVIDFTGLPAGSYRVWARIARWGGTPDTTPIPSATFADNRGHELPYTFPADPAEPLGTWFAMRPGGMVAPEGEWAWLPLFEAGPLQGEYQLTITGEPGPAGTGNYKGLWVDAFRFAETTGAPWPRLREEEALPGRWEGGLYLTTLCPELRGLALIFPAAEFSGWPPGGERHGVRSLLRRTFIPLLEADRDHLALWIMATQRTEPLQVVLKDDQGRQVSEDLCQLANDRPLRPGVWYYLLWPFQAGGALVVRHESAVPGGALPNWGR